MYEKKYIVIFFSAKTQKCIKTNQACIMHHCFDYFIHYLETFCNQLGAHVIWQQYRVRPLEGATQTHLSARAGALRWGRTRVFPSRFGSWTAVTVGMRLSEAAGIAESSAEMCAQKPEPSSIDCPLS